ncbi:LytTR family DNA-binding domain-containing protein [Paenibacillus methanolicus]|uniref:LytTr DNA-binding domain-containing protein n=1 Tax=Paenibacillus methanolicus TaxID=582686 RepID=A0A5S5CAZ4_9BACL|nr:LytTR family DNA-binding domain-containing protein [Paenibacillus methanolicus]TYP75526.1 LytTr DNA-binding domain-containing protein [Paenibacillus methanolicus]
MKVIFGTDASLEKNLARITTNPAEQADWSKIENAIRGMEQKIVVINAKNGRSVEVARSAIAVIQSEDRMSSVRLITGEMYLLNKRLKYVEEEMDPAEFLKINNQTIINTRYIQEFFSTEHARVKVVLSDQSSYFVSRHYIKSFRGKLQ